MLKSTKKLFGDLLMKKKYIFNDIKADYFNKAVKEVSDYSKILPLCHKSEIVKVYDKDNFDALLEINFGVFRDQYISEVRCKEYDEDVSEATQDSIMKYLYSRWNFYDEGGNLIVNYELKMEMQNQMQQLMVKAMNNIIASQTIKAMTEKARQLQHQKLEKNINQNQKFLQKNLKLFNYFFQILAQNDRAFFKLLKYNYQTWTFLRYKTTRYSSSSMERSKRKRHLDNRKMKH